MKIVYQNPWFEVHQDGQWHYVHEPDAANGAVVLAFVGERLVLVKVPRHAHGCALWELPRGYGATKGAGTFSEPETATECAARELLEETGYAAAPEAFAIIGVVRPNTAVLSSALTVCRVQLPASAVPGPRDHEATEVALFTPAEIRDRIACGDLTCGISLAALMLQG